jgi:hypothetical protein
MLRWVFLAIALCPLPAAAQAPLSLYCARGAGEYPDAEMTFHPEGSHVVDVVFVGYRPSRARAEWSLRDCLNTAAKLDGSRNIVALLWYRERGQRLQSPLEPFGPSRRLVYHAATKQVAVERPRPFDALSLANSLGSSSFSPPGTR